MQRFLRTGTLSWLLAVVVWRLVSEVECERRALAATGELDRRVKLRRRARIARAIERDVPGASFELLSRWTDVWSGRRLPARVAVPVRAAVADVPGATNGTVTDTRIRAAMHAGAVSLGDIDDMALLDGAMRRAVVDGIGLSAHGIERRRQLHVAGVHLAWLALGALGVALTALPLVRPLWDGAPLLAGAGAACAAIAWVGARRSGR